MQIDVKALLLEGAYLEKAEKDGKEAEKVGVLRGGRTHANGRADDEVAVPPLEGQIDRLAPRYGGSLSHSTLISLLTYYPDTGVFLWNLDRTGGIRKGDVAGTEGQGYRRISVQGRIYAAHRLAWFWMTGTWPTVSIDHISGDGFDNSWDNLRLATHRQNHMNRKVHREGRLPGAQWASDKQKWFVRIYFRGKRKHLGYFKTEEEAHRCYIEALKERGVPAEFNPSYIERQADAKT